MLPDEAIEAEMHCGCLVTYYVTVLLTSNITAEHLSYPLSPTFTNIHTHTLTHTNTHTYTCIILHVSNLIYAYIHTLLVKTDEEDSILDTPQDGIIVRETQPAPTYSPRSFSKQLISRFGLSRIIKRGSNHPHSNNKPCTKLTINTWHLFYEC